jgi:hypothetical protein
MSSESAAQTTAELQKRIDALLDEGLTTDEIMARLEAERIEKFDREFVPGCDTEGL